MFSIHEYLDSEKAGTEVCVYVLCSLLNGDVELNSEKLMKRRLASGDVVNGVVEQVDTAF